MKLKKSSIVVLCLILPGCSSIAPLLPPTKPQQDLLTPCPTIPKTTAQDLGEIVQEYVDLINKYGECAARHRKLSEAVK